MWWTAAVTDPTPASAAPVGSHAQPDALAGEQGDAADPTPVATRSFTVHPRRGRKVLQTVRDMVFSLGAIGAAVAVILVITHRPLPDPVRVVDLAPVVTQAKSLVSWPVLGPSSELKGWRATSARIEPATKVSAGPVVAFGFVTPSGAWLGVKQAGVRAATASAWVRSVLEAAGEVSGSALRSTGGASYLVYGTGTDAERRALLGALGLRP